MGSAPAEVPRERVFNLFPRWLRRLIQQRLCHRDHPVCATAALGGLPGNEGGLTCIRPIGLTEPFDRVNGAIRDLMDRSHT
jgi:hypothetical protein